MSAFRPCCRSWSIKKPAGPLGENRGPWLCAPLVLDYLAVLDSHHVHARYVLRALLARRALLDERDVAVDALYLHVPERLRDRLGFGLARRLDRLDDGVHAVPAAEALGEAADVVAALLPLGDEVLVDVGILTPVAERRREEHHVEAAVRAVARLLDELIRRVRAAGGDDALLLPLLLRLLQDQRDLLDRGGDEERVA